MNLKLNKEITMSDQIKKEEIISEKENSFNKSRKYRLIFSVLTVFLFAVLIKGIAFAQPMNRHGDGPMFLIGKISKNLDLTIDQKAKVENIMEQIKQKMEANKPDRESMFNEFAEQFKKDKLDKNQILEDMKAKELKSQEMKEFMLDKIIEFHSILTPEQRNKAVEEMKAMKENFQDRKREFRNKKEQN